MILQLAIENYKSIEKVSLKFEEINVLIGKNGAGKTTLISVINMLMKLAGGANINSVVNSVAPFGDEFFNANTNSRHAKFSLIIQIPAKVRYEYSFSIGFGDRITNDLAGSFYVDTESLYKIGDENKELIFRRTNRESNIEILNEGVVEKMPLSVDPRVLALSSYSQGDTKLVAKTLSSYSVIWVDTPYQQTNFFEVVSSNEPNLNTIDGVAVNLYLKDRDLFSAAMDAIKSIIPGFTVPEITNIADNAFARRGDLKPEQDRKKINNYVVSWSDSIYSKTYGISRMSLSGGNSRVIFLILSLYNSEASSCFVAEEIENGMHLSRIAKMIDQMRMIVKNRKIQLFFTTHNHLILDDLLPKEVIFTSLGEQGSEYTRLTETREYQDVKQDLGRTPSSTEVVDSGLLFT